jgi:putative FmdB family regulatory protein
MPIYIYQCIKCKREVEIFQRITDPPIKKCKFCGGKLIKLISNTSFILKGSGWYATSSKEGNKNKKE